MSTPIRAVVLTISDSAAQGTREDLSGPAVVAELQAINAAIVATEILADERALIAARLRFYADQGQANLVLTTGGTGLSPRDITPEATREVIDREAPGLAELMRAESLRLATMEPVKVTAPMKTPRKTSAECTAASDPASAPPGSRKEL